MSTLGLYVYGSLLRTTTSPTMGMEAGPSKPILHTTATIWVIRSQTLNGKRLHQRLMPELLPATIIFNTLKILSRAPPLIPYLVDMIVCSTKLSFVHHQIRCLLVLIIEYILEYIETNVCIKNMRKSTFVHALSDTLIHLEIGRHERKWVTICRVIPTIIGSIRGA